MRTVSEKKSWGGKSKPTFNIQYYVSKILPFKTKCGKIL
jgi:hypothetical protein